MTEREWFVLDSMGERIGRVNTDKARCMSRLDFFLLMFPPEHLTRIIAMTNEQLRSKERKEITKGELLKFFGVIILGTRLEFGSRSDLWAMTSLSSFIDAPKFGEKTGMSTTFYVFYVSRILFYYLVSILTSLSIHWHSYSKLHQSTQLLHICSISYPRLLSRELLLIP